MTAAIGAEGLRGGPAGQGQRGGKGARARTQRETRVPHSPPLLGASSAPTLHDVGEIITSFVWNIGYHSHLVIFHGG